MSHSAADAGSESVAVAPVARYQAFLSYSHADAQVARGVQKALQSIGRRVGRPSAMRVFRDDTDLSAAPDLWGRVRQAMDAAGHLIVVLSPQAAASDWVDREVRHWLETRGSQGLLFVLAAGEASYDEVGRRLDPRSDAVPPALTQPGVLGTEPVYVDVREDAPWDAAASGFRDRVMSLAAEIQGRPKSELAGDDLRERKRFRRWRRTVTSALSVLTVVSLVLAVVAVNRSSEATRQRNEAVSLALAAAAEGLVGVNDSLAVALASEAMAATETPRWQAVRALVSARVSLADRPVVRVGAPWAGYWGFVSALAFSPDGKRLASAGGDGTVRVWDPTTRSQVGAPLAHEGEVDDVAFSPDGRILATAGWGPVRLWDPADGHLLREIQTGLDSVLALAFSPDGSVLACGGVSGGILEPDATTAVHLWDLQKGALIGPPLVGGTVFSLAFSPDGKQLAVGYEGSVGVWSPSTGKLLRRLVQPRDESGTGPSTQSLAFTPGGGVLVSVSFAGFAQYWDPSSGALIRELSTSNFADAAYLASISDDSIVTVNAALQQMVSLWVGSNGAIAFSPDGTRIAAAGARGIQLFTLDVAPIAGRVAQGSPIQSMAFSPDGGSIGVVREDGTASLVDPVTWKTARELVPPGGFKAEVIEFSPTGTAMIAGTRVPGPDPDIPYEEVEVWRVEPAATDPEPTILRLGRVDGYLSEMSFSPDGQLLGVLARSGSLILYDLATGQTVRQLNPCDLAAPDGEDLVFSPDGQTLAVSCSHDSVVSQVRLWDVTTGKARATLSADKAVRTTDIEFSPNGLFLATGSYDGIVHLWDSRVGQLVGDPLLPDGMKADTDYGVRAMAFDPGSNLLASGGGNGTVRLWDVPSQQPVGALPVEGYVNQLLFSPDGRTLIAWTANDSEEKPVSEVRQWTGLWEQDAGCAIAARYVDRAQLDPYLPEGWTTVCPYVQ